MHFRTHLTDKNLGKSAQDDYSDRMVTHDEQIGQMLNKLDELGIADNTIVMYSTDNGPENDTWPDGANLVVTYPLERNQNRLWPSKVTTFRRGRVEKTSLFEKRHDGGRGNYRAG